MKTFFFQKSCFYSSKFWFLPPKNFFYPLNTCKSKIKSAFYSQLKTTIIGENMALKLDVFTKSGFYSFKIAIFIPWNHIFSPGTVAKTFKMVNFVELRSFTRFHVCYRHFRLLSWFIFIYTILPGTKFQNFVLGNKSLIKVWQIWKVSSSVYH